MQVDMQHSLLPVMSLVNVKRVSGVNDRRMNLLNLIHLRSVHPVLPSPALETLCAVLTRVMIDGSA